MGGRRRWLATLALLAVVGGVLGIVAQTGGQLWLATTMRGSGDSMSHGPATQGILDDGDMGHYQKHPAFADILTMVTAREEGLEQVAGDWGDVLVYRADGQARTDRLGMRVLVEHRALLWLAYDEATGLFDAPELGLTGIREVTIPGVGTWDPEAGTYVRSDMRLVLVQDGPEGRTYPAGQHSGWVAKGDHNGALDQHPGADGKPLSTLVRPEWVEARLLNVVDQGQVVFDGAVGAGAAMVLGGAALLGWQWARKGSPRAPALGGAKCGCGSAWSDLAFCGRCGAERAPRTRYASPEAMAAARASARRR